VCPDARLSLPDGLFAPNELVRELGARPNAVYVVRQASVGVGGKPLLAVAERFTGSAEGEPDGGTLAREGRRIATLASPNLARVREVTARGNDLVAIGEFIEGEKLQELWRPEKLPLEIALRVIVDVLTGVGALHGLRDARQQPMKLAHGELSPATVVLGLDGIARVLYAVSRRAPGAEPEPASIPYLSPEVASGDSYDARADVFSAGVMLWEALSGKRLLAGSDRAANARTVRDGALALATVPDKASWAKGLVQVAARALAAAPDDRWPTAAAMAAEVRKAAGLKLAPASTAAAFARSAFGERVKARRESLDTGPSIGPPAKSEPAVVAAAPVTRTAPSEPPSIDVELDAAVDTVLVAPGVRAQVAEVVELGSESLIDVSADSLPPPPAPAVAVSRIVSVQPGPTAQQPPPTFATEVAHPAPPIDVRPVLPAPTPAPFRVEPYVAPASLEGDLEDVPVASPDARRRKVFVLGGVAAFGVVVFALAAVRALSREPDATAISPRSPPTTPATGDLVPSPAPSAPASVSSAAAAPPAVATAVPPTAQAAAPAVTSPVVKPAPLHVTTTPRSAPVSRGTAGKARPKPTFDPNSL
jgi:hypothetical protein